MRVVQLTDIHLTPERGSRLYGIDPAQTLEQIIGEVVQLDLKPELIIATGDLADDGSELSYARLREILGRLDIPVYTLPGNHDDMSVMRESLNSGHFHCVKQVEFDSWGFVFIESQVAGFSHGCVAAEELAVLDRSLAEMRDKPVLVAMHHTPTAVCPSSGCQLSNVDEFLGVLDRHANAAGVIAGHTHNAMEKQVGGHVQFTTPSTFAYAVHAQRGEPVDHEDFWDAHKLDGTRRGFRTLDLQENGSIKTQVHWVTGNT